MLSGEKLELLGLGYRRVFFAELYCATHGAIRIGLEVAPEERQPCPVCRRLCSCSRALCVGFTRHALPFFEGVVCGRVISGLIRLDEPINSARRKSRHGPKSGAVKVAKLA